MIKISRRTLLASLASLPAAGILAGAARATEARRIPYELVQDALRVDGAAFVGARQPDVVMIEFFDYNCAFCRRSAQDMEILIGTDERLGYVLVNYAILGERSVEATRIALAYLAQQGHEKYLDFHLAMFARRGVADGERALDVAKELGAEPDSLLEFAESDAVTQATARAVSIGNALGLHATPSYLVGPWAFDGHIELEQKLRIIDDLRN